jgi:hypothetical protein
VNWIRSRAPGTVKDEIEVLQGTIVVAASSDWLADTMSAHRLLEESA